MNIFDRTKTALGTITPAVPIALDRLASLPGQSLPPVYLVFLLVTAPVEQWADNRIILRTYHMQVSAYSVNGLNALPDFNTAMTAAGFIESTKRQLPQDPHSGHYGLAQDYFFTE